MKGERAQKVAMIVVWELHGERGERSGEKEIWGQTAKTKGHLRGHTETYYRRNFL